MKIKLVTINSEFDSAKRLRFETVTDIPGTISQDTVYIRWGNGLSLNQLNDFPHVVNSSMAIRKNCTKDWALSILSQVVNTPQFFKKETSIPKGKKIVLRPTSHSAGIGFQLKTGPYTIPHGYYGTLFLKTNFEYRVWFCNEKTMWALRVPINGQNEKESPCRSNWGYRFRNHEKVPPDLHKQVILAAQAIGLESGAADILFYKKKYYFLELNSAPSIDNWRLEVFFKENLLQHIKRKFHQLHESTCQSQF